MAIYILLHKLHIQKIFPKCTTILKRYALLPSSIIQKIKKLLMGSSKTMYKNPNFFTLNPPESTDYDFFLKIPAASVFTLLTNNSMQILVKN